MEDGTVPFKLLAYIFNLATAVVLPDTHVTPYHVQMLAAVFQFVRTDHAPPA